MRARRDPAVAGGVDGEPFDLEKRAGGDRAAPALEATAVVEDIHRGSDPDGVQQLTAGLIEALQNQAARGATPAAKRLRIAGPWCDPSGFATRNGNERDTRRHTFGIRSRPNE